MQRFVLLAVAVAMAGCATTPPVRKVAFDPEEYSRYAGEGTGTLTGQAFLVTNGGDVKTAAGCTISINPVTRYSTEWFNRVVLRGEVIEEPDDRAISYNQRTTADADGRFRFDGLPAGEYYVTSLIRWRVGSLDTGGFAYAKATVRDGQVTDVIVSRPR